MGLSTKQVSGDGFDWGQSLLHPDNSLELLPEPPPLPPPPVTSARRQPPQQQSEQLPCPRCASTNTKFCYYNNYNKSQPRHFCKACKRHWTKGGTLRNVPVGGGRKNKRHKTSNAAATTSKSNTHMGIQKNMSEFHYQGLNLIPPPPPPPASSAHDNFFSSFESNPSSISASFRCSDAYNFTGGLDFIEDTTITTAAAAAIMATATTTTTTTASIGSQSWQAVPTTTTNGTTDMPNYWNWDDFESLVTSTEINIPWDDDDTEIKP